MAMTLSAQPDERHTDEVPPPAPGCPVDLSGDGWEGGLASKVKEGEGTTLVVQPPFAPFGRGTRMVLGQPGDAVVLRWSAQAGLAEVHAEVVECPTRPVTVWRLRLTSAPAIAQRRAHHRVPVTVPVSLLGARSLWLAHTLDVSEGGMRCVAPGRIEPLVGEVVDAVFDAVGSVRAAARVLRVTRISDDDVDLAMQFDDLRLSDAERLHDFLDEQRSKAAADAEAADTTG